MATEKRSFEELLREAPEAPGDDTVSLVGTLARSRDEGKFVLTVAGGQAVTLDVSAVKDHEVIGSSVGQMIVRVDVDRSCLPSEVVGEGATPVASDTAGQRNTARNWDPTAIGHDVKFGPSDAWFQFARVAGGTPVAADTAGFTLTEPTGPWQGEFKLNWQDNPEHWHQRTLPHLDYPTVAWFDHPNTGIPDVVTIPWIDQGGGTVWQDPGPGTLQETIPDPTGGIDPAAQGMPFSLATQHQAPPAVMAALGGLKPRLDPKIPFHDPGTLYWDPGTHPFVDPHTPFYFDVRPPV